MFFLLMSSYIVVSCTIFKKQQSFALKNHNYFSPIFLQLNSDGTFIYTDENGFTIARCTKGIWKQEKDSIILENFKSCDIYSNDTAMKTYVLELEDSIQSIRLGHIRNLNGIKSFILNNKDTLANYLIGDTLVAYPKQITSILTDEPDYYEYDTTKYYKIVIHQFKLKRTVYDYVKRDFSNFHIEKDTLSTIKDGRLIKLTKIKNEEFNKAVFSNHIIE